MDEKIQNSNNFFTMNFINENNENSNENLITEFETQKNSPESIIITNEIKNDLIFLNSNENFKIDDDVYKIKKKKPGRKKKTKKQKKKNSFKKRKWKHSFKNKKHFL